MSRRLFVALALVVGLLPAQAFGQTFGAAPVKPRLDLSGALVNTTVPSVLLDADQLVALQRPSFDRRSSRGSSAVLASLYVSTAVMQALDVHSTLTAFDNGAVEANPLMKNVAGNKAAFMALKAGVAVSTILASRNMAKKNKAAAIATMVAVNVAYAMVARHNYQLAHAGR